MKNLKNYFMAFAAIIIAISSVTLMSFKENLEVSRFISPITLYFHGDTSDPNSVTNPANWREQPNGEECDTGTIACSMTVEDTDLTGTFPTRTLNGSQIELTAENNGSNQYAPEKLSGPGSEPTIHNKN
ncbi:hypothetical protein [Sphingobacterium bovistauri]|uniref:Secreted protein n=1 Tax=Sphingobacterium bovistauri TaxID=2781959 RepID=A0ABS7Z1K9_9SPHI|nr:hypothetical protein [Sphingobacterium bovistauri]MCA5004058.1 hypothetical protein [Sphingobacterium bovistauri]